MRVLVLGAGAVGLTVAAKLSEQCDVHAVCREHHALAIHRRGFRMTGAWGEGHFLFSAAPDLPDEARFDAVFVTCKGADTRDLCEQFAYTLEGTAAVSLQNGIGNEEILGEFAGTVIGGALDATFEWRDHAAVHVAARGGPLLLGRFPEGRDVAAEKLAEVFREVRIAAESTDAIRGARWARALRACALDPLGAIMDTPVGRLTDPNAWSVVADVVRETFAVARADGVALPWPDVEACLADLHDEHIPSRMETRSAMAGDIGRGRATEIDLLNGVVVARGRALGIPTPVNETLVHVIRFKERLAGLSGGNGNGEP